MHQERNGLTAASVFNCKWCICRLLEYEHFPLSDCQQVAGVHYHQQCLHAALYCSHTKNTNTAQCSYCVLEWVQHAGVMAHAVHKGCVLSSCCVLCACYMWPATALPGQLARSVHWWTAYAYSSFTGPCEAQAV